jgi:DeoR/GlpR family transcriptional regulator of sugar metabolism
MIPVAPLSAADIVVSDTGLKAEHAAMLRDSGVELILA